MFETKTLKIMNSAMMPQPGSYRAAAITQDEFVDLLQANSNSFISYVGYEATANHITAISGVRVPVSRAETVLEDGDVMLVCKLNFRLADPKRKADRNYIPAPEDYEYLRVDYKEVSYA